MTTDRPRNAVVDPADLPGGANTDYPDPFRTAVERREKRKLGDAVGLTNFGVNLVRLPPGAASTQRHWHTKQDEFVYVLEGEVVLLTDAGEQVLFPGMCAGFPAGSGDGHQLLNRSDRDARYLEIGDRTPDDEVGYPDIDLLVRWIDGVEHYVHKDGTPY